MSWVAKATIYLEVKYKTKEEKTEAIILPIVSGTVHHLEGIIWVRYRYRKHDYSKYSIW